jgi:hypothetical protein
MVENKGEGSENTNISNPDENPNRKIIFRIQ